LHPEHEQAVADILRKQGYPVSASNEILAEFREFERASTTMVNAYVSPVLDRYLSRLENEILDRDKTARLRVMQSNGGNMSIEEVRRGGVHCILSGPAGGVVGAGCIARLAQFGGALERTSETELPAPLIKVISFDMGGTSTDAALIDGEAQLTTEAVVSGCPIHIPMLDIHTIGAGGGSIAQIDRGGALRVGPESVGADPGPACYGRGDLPTVTDANLVLGRLASDYFLGGKMILDRDRAQRAVAQLAEALGLDLLQTALGIVEVVNAHMERALRVISVERGHDPRLFTLLSFGGAGGLHAVDLARRLGVRLALVPPLASTLSAFGMLNADVIKDGSQTVMLSGETGIDEIAGRFTALISNLKKTFDSGENTTKNTRPADLMIEMFVDMRYQGQSYELTIPFTEHLHADFHQAHRKVYGFAREERPVELVNLRVRLVQRTSPLTLPESAQNNSDPSRAWLGRRPVVVSREHGFQEISFYRGEDLYPGNRLVGPAVVLRKDTTIFLGGTDLANVDRFGNLLIEVGE
jgi:N-methylhydantoinase A